MENDGGLRNRRESDRRLEKLETDVYFGGGPHSPSITTRLSLLEDGMDRITKLTESMAKSQNKGLWLLLTLLGTGLLNVVLHFAGK